MDKQLCRKEIRKRLRECDPEELQLIDREICHRLAALPCWEQADTVFSYVPFGREMDVTPLNKLALAQGKRLCIPLITGEGLMEICHIQDYDTLKPGSYDILEPSTDSPRIQAGDIKLALIPGMAFSPEGWRLGRGGGFYDRWLANYQGYTLAPTREIQIMDEIPHESWDIPVQAVLTQSRLLTGK